jgi:predicted PurR-regulated permease PerM
MNLDTFGGRRFLLTVATQISVTALVWFAKISDDVYSVVVLATVAAYITGNVVQRVKAPNGTDHR